MAFGQTLLRAAAALRRGHWALLPVWGALPMAAAWAETPPVPAPEAPVVFSLVVRPARNAAEARPAGEDFSRELIEVVCRAANLPCTIREFSNWPAAMEEFQLGTVDVVPAVAQLPERRAQMLFSVPHSRASLSVFSLKSTGVLRDAAALAGRRVAVIATGPGDHYLRSLPTGAQAVPVRVQTTDEQLRLLLAGEVDALLTTNLAGMEMFAAHPISGRIVVSPPLAGTEVRFAMAVRPGRDALLARLNDGLFLAQQTGEIDRIYGKWFGRFRFNYDPADRWLRGLGAGVVALLGLAAAALLASRWRLRRVQQRAADVEALVATRTRELAAAHLRLQALFDHSPLGILVVDADDPAVPFRITDCNSRAAEIYGYPRAELVGASITRLLTSDQPRSDWTSPLLQRLAHDGTVFGTATHRRSNGEDFPLEFALTLVPLDGRRLLLGIGRDISSEQRTARALQQAEERFRLLLEHSPSGFWDIDYRGGQAWYSPRIREMLGQTEADLPDQPGVWENLAHPDDLAAFRQLRDTSRPPGRHPMTFEVRFRHRDGGWRWIRMDGIMTFDEGGLARSLGFLTDITRLHSTAEELAASRARYRTLFEDAAIPLWEDDLSAVKLWVERLRAAGGAPDLATRLLADRGELEHGASLVRVLTANRACLEMYHARDLAEVDTAMRRLIIADGGATFAATTARLAGGANTFHIEKATATLDGRPLQIALIGKVLPGFEDTWGRVLISALDITDKTATDERLRRQDAELAQSRKLRALGELAGGIAHEFNNLLTPMLLQVDLLLRERGADCELVSQLHPIQTAVGAARELTQRILAFGRKSERQSSEVGLARLVEENANLLRLTMDRRITLRAIVAADLPAVWHNRTDLNQALLNLLLNARDTLVAKLSQPHPPDWSPQVTVRLARPEPAARPAAARLGAWQLLTVEDNGQGMSPAVRERIFEPFFTTKESGVGTGLGLATVWHLVAGMGGFVLVESTPGAGSCFQLWLPETARPAQAAPEEPAAPPASPAPPVAADGRRRVLLVEDNPMVALVTRACLQREGYTLTHLEDGLAAWAQLQHTPQAFDLIITDLNMPGLSGLDLIRRSRTAGYTGRFIVISGLLTPDVLADLGAAGITATVKKPFDLADLRAALELTRR